MSDENPALDTTVVYLVPLFLSWLPIVCVKSLAQYHPSLRGELMAASQVQLYPAIGWDNLCLGCATMILWYGEIKIWEL